MTSDTPPALIDTGAAASAPPPTAFSPSSITDESLLAQLYNQPPPLPVQPSLSNDPMLQSLSAINQSLLGVMDNLYRCCLTLDTPAPTGETNETLVTNLDRLLVNIGEVDATVRRHSSNPVMIPITLIEQIDSGVNPELLLSQALDRASTVNDAMRGKMAATLAMQQSLEILSRQLAQSAPHNEDQV